MPVIVNTILRDSSDVEIHVSGTVEDGETFGETILNPKNLRDSPNAVKLSSFFYSIQDGLTMILYWEGEDEHTLIMPIEGRGVLDLTRFGGIENPRRVGWTGGVYLVASPFKEGTKHFTFTFEFSKQRV